MPDGTPCWVVLLNLLRKQLRIDEFDQFPVADVYREFADLQNQLNRVKNIDPILKWVPMYAEDDRAEVYPSIVEVETSPFRHGPPGCEDVLRALFFQFPNEVVPFMMNQIQSAPVEINRFIHS